VSDDEITVFRNGDSIISYTACVGGFSSLQAASNSMNKRTVALAIMHPSRAESPHIEARSQMAMGM